MRRGVRTGGLVLGLAAALGLAAFFGVRHWRTRNLSRVQRGYRVAEAKGCFNCHGPGGLRGMANPGHEEGEVPPFTGGLITMYAESEAEIREWILDGLPARIRDDPAQMALRQRALIAMPPWRSLLSEREVDDLVAYVKAASDFEAPDDPAAAEGKAVAERFGCFNCHGPQGRGSPPNVRSLKGYIPSWDGPDFRELATSEAEVREWILDGRPGRLMESRVARYFLQRQPIQMPAYRGYLEPREVDQLVAYIRWVQAHPY